MPDDLFINATMSILKKRVILIWETYRHKSDLRRDFIIKDVRYLDTENKLIVGSIYWGACRLTNRPKGCESEISQSYGYFFDHDKVCFPLSIEDPLDKKPTSWKEKFEFDVK